MKNWFKLEPGLPALSTIKAFYYILLFLSLLAGIICILEGINDPFGEMAILLGVLILLIIPILLRIAFGLIIKQK